MRMVPVYQLRNAGLRGDLSGPGWSWQSTASTPVTAVLPDNPRDLEEAAKLDGAGFTTFWRVMPLAGRPWPSRCVPRRGTTSSGHW
jgi:ABC-type glycerol-3-phosphate transport system permease component